MKYEWKPIAKSLKKILPVSSIKVLPENGSAALFLHSSVVAILTHLPKTEELNEAISIAYRASCPPAEAGIISAICANYCILEFDDYFEFDYTGQKLYGKEALRFAWARGSDFVEPSDQDKFMTDQVYQPN